ncbi:hypothetical protein [Pedobacter sp.]
MKKIFALLIVFWPYICWSQVTPPSNVYFSINEVSGNGDPNTTVKIDRNVGGLMGFPIISIAVNINGYFKYTFESPLAIKPGSPAVQPKISIWAESTTGIESVKVEYTALESSEALQKIINGNLLLPSNKAKTVIVNPDIDGGQQPSTTFRYKVKMLNTNFTIPLARFNFVGDQSGSKKGEILLFNSIGAGIGVSWGEIEKTSDANGSTINTDFTNTFGLHLGLLFSSGKDGSEQKNIFAPTFAVSVLDFQFGLGYELGTTAAFQKKAFVTLAYAIPLSKLIKGKYYIFTASKGYNSTNPLSGKSPSESNRTSKNIFIN